MGGVVPHPEVGYGCSGQNVEHKEPPCHPFYFQSIHIGQVHFGSSHSVSHSHIYFTVYIWMVKYLWSLSVSGLVGWHFLFANPVFPPPPHHNLSQQHASHYFFPLESVRWWCR